MWSSVLLVAGIAVLERVLFESVLKKRFKVSFIGTPVRTALYFLTVTAVLFALFPQEITELFTFSPVGVGVLFITVTWWIPHIYRETRARYGKTIPVLPLHKDLELLRINERFILPKFTDVLFQQTAIALVITLIAPNVQIGELLPVFALLFLLFHLGLILKMSFSWALYFALSAGVAGMLIPLLVLYVPGGIYYLVTFHLLWYIFSGSHYWKKRAKRK